VTALAVAGESSIIKNAGQHVLPPVLKHSVSVPISVGPAPRDSCAIACWPAVLSSSVPNAITRTRLMALVGVIVLAGADLRNSAPAICPSRLGRFVAVPRGQ